MSHITIFSASIGNGHNEASKALKEQFELQGNTVTIVDTFYSIHPLLHKAFLVLYLNIIKHLPRLWGRLYKYSANYSWYFLMDHLGALFCKQLNSIICENETNVIVSTHPFVTAFLSKLKRKKKLELPLYTVITDLGLHPAYLRPEINGYFTASPNHDHFASRYKVPVEQFYCTGIPIKSIPAPTIPRWKLRNNLNLKQDEKTVLITGGGLGLVKYIEILEALEALDEKLQILCLTGHNDKVKKRIDAFKSMHRVHTIAYTEKFTDYLRASDVILSKAGGLTMSEALACETPIVVYEPVPGHEEHNADLLIEFGTAVKAENVGEVVESLQTLLFNEHFYQSFVNNAKKLKKPYAAKHIATVIQDLEKRKQVQ